MKKQLLKESEVRKLMKFANIGALTDGFVSRITEADMMEPDEEDEAMPGMDSPDAPVGVDPDAPPEPDQSLEDPEALGAEEEVGGEDAAGAEGVAPAVSEFVQAVDLLLQQVAGTDPGTVVADTVAGDEGPPVDAAAGPEEDALDAAAGPEDEEEEVELGEDIVQEVARRVARRLKKLRRR